MPRRFHFSLFTFHFFWVLWTILCVLGAPGGPIARERITAFEPLPSLGPGTMLEAMEPSLRKWYVPQEVFHYFGWEPWRYTNYAKVPYERYTPEVREGKMRYDIYGNPLGRGWEIYSWKEFQPRDKGSNVLKSAKYIGWFDELLISAASKGQYYTALTIGDQIRTTFTPLTFSKPTFNGIQWDFLTDRWGLTMLISRISEPGRASTMIPDPRPPQSATDYTRLLGVRGTVALRDAVVLGGTYVSAQMGGSLDRWRENSLKGQLTSGQNWGTVREIVLRISDDSPEDGGGGAMLFWEQIYIDGRPADLGANNPTIRGGIHRRDRYEANGREALLLTYDLSNVQYQDKRGTSVDASGFRKVGFALVLANDYKVEITSNLQLDEDGQPIFLPVAQAEGNVKDATNQRVVTFEYGLPTGNEIMGATLEVNDVWGWDLRAEYNVNGRHRRFPNRNPEIEDHALSSDRSTAFYAMAAKRAFPWFAFGEVFDIDGGYSTTAYIVGAGGKVYYDDRRKYWFEFVEDNDDQDRYPDWTRNSVNQRAGSDILNNDGIFPGLDENNDLIPDFNQNENFQPDYQEPFLQYDVDPPEFLFGVDMNHNTWIDRFENDEEPDYPYKRDRRGYNVYGGVEALRGVKVLIGHLSEQWVSTDRKSRAIYGLLTLEKDIPRVGLLRVFEHIQIVHDNIPDDLVQWIQLPNTIKGSMVPISDPLMARNTVIQTAYADFHYIGLRNANVFAKVKHEGYHQRDVQPGLPEDSQRLTVVGKADWRVNIGDHLTVHPKVKSMILRTDDFPAERDRKEWWNMLFLMMRYGFLDQTWGEFGFQYTLFRDRAEKGNNFHGTVFAFQLSNESSFLGYRLRTNLGFRTGARFFKKRTRAGSLAFVNVFAGIAE